MRECVIHFGMPKTGSSAIQGWLLRALDDPAFHCIGTGERGSGNLIAQTFMDDATQHHRNRKRAVGNDQLRDEHRRLRAAFERSLAACPADATAIFSAELLSNLADGEFARVTAALGCRGAPLRAVGYVRPPVSYMQSVFQQRVKSGAVEFDPARNYPRYRDRLAKFESLPGASAAGWWLYDPRAFPAGCVVRDFCARLGIRLGVEPPPRANESLSLPAIRLLWAYRRFGPGFGSGAGAIRDNALLRRQLNLLIGPRLRFHAELTVPVLHAQREDICWMEERLEASLAEPPCEAPDALRREEDLLRFDEESLAWLAAQPGTGGARLGAGATPQDIAAAMHGLRRALAAADEAATRGARLGARIRALFTRP
ncbi:MAG: hypothetical protein CALGDGBN_00836 [Pseudomonadales bacterium]|nr:hypothetical protein [Pseudomonadales bacterium]